MVLTNLLNQITVLLGGRSAEEVALGAISTGAQNDLQRASDMARSMVTEWGMSDSIGLVHFDQGKRSRFLDVAMPAQRGPYSEETAQAIDHEVLRIVSESHATARRILTERRELLEQVTRRLLEKEVMEGEELRAMMAPAPLVVPEPVPHPEGGPAADAAASA